MQNDNSCITIVLPRLKLQAISLVWQIILTFISLSNPEVLMQFFEYLYEQFSSVNRGSSVDGFCADPQNFHSLEEFNILPVVYDGASILTAVFII